MSITFALVFMLFGIFSWSSRVSVHGWNVATSARLFRTSMAVRSLSVSDYTLYATKRSKVSDISSDLLVEKEGLVPSTKVSKKEPEPVRFYCNPPDDCPPAVLNSSSHVIFTVYGEPMALARHRASKFGIMYNPSAKFQKQFLQACSPYLPTAPYPGPIEATVKFYLQRPKNHYGSGKNSHIMRKDAPLWPCKRLGECFVIC
jgi:hypothetical protein